METLLQENKRLKTSLTDLIHNANKNQSVLEKIHAFELKLLDCGSFSNLINLLLKEATKYLAIDDICLVLYDPFDRAKALLSKEDLKLPIVFTSSLMKLQRMFPDGLTARLGRYHSHYPLINFPSSSQVKSSALIPLVRQESIIGSLNIGSHSSEQYVEDMGTDFLTHLSKIVAICIENAITQENLLRLSTTDPLTQTHNRRSFMKRLYEEMSRCERAVTPIAILYIDIDHFKHINDEFGHPLGDLALQMVAALIGAQLRRSDTLSRYGGEEFTVSLPTCDEAIARQTAERIRQIVNSTPIDVKDDKLKLSVSIGVCSVKPEYIQQLGIEACADLMLNCADTALYQAKRSGRNRVCYQNLQAFLDESDHNSNTSAAV